MTFVGKLLVVIQLVLTICFMVLAGAVFSRQQSWKARAETLEASVATEKKAYTQLEEELKKEITDLKDREKNAQNSATDARNELTQVRNERDAQKVELDTLKTQLNTQTSLARISGDEATFRREESLAQRRINEQLSQTLNTQNERVRQLEDDVFNRDVERKALVERYNEQLQTVAIYKRVLASNGFETDPRKYSRQDKPTEIVFGKVLDTKPAAGKGRELVEISIGSDDGLLEGTVMYVYRVGDKNQFLAEIRLELVKPDQAVGVVINSSKNGVIERGDFVSTKL